MVVKNIKDWMRIQCANQAWRNCLLVMSLAQEGIAVAEAERGEGQA